LLVVVTRGDGGAPPDELGIKGGAGWQVFGHRGDRTFAVHDGARLEARDQIRFVVTPQGAHYLLVVSVDGAGKASVYYPYDGTQSGALTGDGRVELPGSIVLDAAPGPERLYAIFSDAPIEVDSIMAQLRAVGARGGDAVRRTRSLELTARAQLSLVFEKATP
jgi:hypothetical protein